MSDGTEGGSGIHIHRGAWSLWPHRRDKSRNNVCTAAGEVDHSSLDLRLHLILDARLFVAKVEQSIAKVLYGVETEDNLALDASHHDCPHPEASRNGPSLLFLLIVGLHDVNLPLTTYEDRDVMSTILTSVELDDPPGRDGILYTVPSSVVPNGCPCLVDDSGNHVCLQVRPPSSDTHPLAL